MPFLFATGIENNYPTLADGQRLDQMERCGHYARWEEDFELLRRLGVRAVRYGPAYYRAHVAPHRFDWDCCDQPMERLRALRLEVIADLCHFGVPSWLGGFQDAAFPVLFAEYARAFARRYPWVRYFAPVYQIFACATRSALYGWWNECETSDTSFVRALRNLCLAHELAVEAILSERPEAIIIHSERADDYVPANRRAAPEAERWNRLKLLGLDLTMGHELPAGMAGYLNAHGVTSNDLSFFRQRRGRGRRWLGLGYQETSECIVGAGHRTAPRRRGFRQLAAAYYHRYGVPLICLETSVEGRRAEPWLSERWEDALSLRGAGIPVYGFAWRSLTDRVAWRPDGGVGDLEVRADGLVDLQRRWRDISEAYERLIRRWGYILDVRALATPARPRLRILA